MIYSTVRVILGKRAIMHRRVYILVLPVFWVSIVDGVGKFQGSIQVVDEKKRRINLPRSNYRSLHESRGNSLESTSGHFCDSSM